MDAPARQVDGSIFEAQRWEGGEAMKCLYQACLEAVKNSARWYVSRYISSVNHERIGKIQAIIAESSDCLYRDDSRHPPTTTTINNSTGPSTRE